MSAVIDHIVVEVTDSADDEPTPEMIAAGLEEAWRLYDPVDEEDRVRGVSAIYRAMRRARCTP